MTKFVNTPKEKSTETTSSKIFWALMYLILIIVVLFSACFIFDKTYYTPFYVNGQSMNPTLNDGLNPGYYDYGVVDEHRMAFKSIKRNDLVIAYYNGDFDEDDLIEESSSYSPNEEVVAKTKLSYASDHVKPGSQAKIKRVIGLPNETVTIFKRSHVFEGEKVDYNEIFVSDKDGHYINTTPSGKPAPLDLPFKPNNPNGLTAALNKNIEDAGFDASKVNHFSWKLKEDEMFVMGDNWGKSLDSTSLSVGPIKFDHISGVVIKVEGFCRIENGVAVDKHPYEKVKYFKQ